MLLLESFTLVLLTLPYSLYVTIFNREQEPNDLHTKSINQLAFAIVFYFLYINRCLNFAMYCMSGSRFRSALLEVIRGSKAGQEIRIKLTATPASSCDPIVSVVSKSSL
eukprot:XP_014780579.1 PREDICTED: uncharacterized protein LOC106876516 [Octopus bimaculoides]